MQKGATIRPAPNIPNFDYWNLSSFAANSNSEVKLRFAPFKMCSIQSSFVPLMDFYSLSTYSLPNLKNVPYFLRLPSPKAYNHHSRLRAVLPIEEIPPNALRRKNDPQWRGGFSLGVDLGLSRTGLALSKGFSVRPLMVLELRGQKLEIGLLEIAENEEVDEFIIGLPKSWDGKETPQSNKVRSVAGRLAVRAAERGWRVYLQDEHGTSTEATYRMINMGLGKGARQKSIDAYAAVMVLERYFQMCGEGTELVLPKQLDLQHKLRKGPPKDIDFYPE